MPERLAGQPLQVAVLADVHDRVGAEPALGLRRGEPAVGGQVVVRRRQVRVVVDRDRVLAEAARRLHHQHDVPAAHGGDDDVAARRRTARPGAAPQCSSTPLAEVLRAASSNQRAVASRRRSGSGCPASFSSVSQSGSCPPASISAWISASPSSLGDAREPPSPHVVAGLRHRPEQRDRAGRGVEPDGVADPGVLGRVRRQHQHDPLVRVRDVPQPGVPHGDPGDAGGALGVGHVDRQAVGVELLERERHRDQPAVELGHGDLGGDVERRQPVVVGRPRRAAAGQAEALQDRDVERGELGDVPRLVVAARRRAGRLRAARGEHGDDHRVRRRAASAAARARPGAATRRRSAAGARPRLRSRRRAPRRSAVFPASCWAR